MLFRSRYTGFQSSVAKPTTPKPATTPAPKPATAPTAQKPQTASAAMAQVFKGVPGLGAVANIANRYDRASNYRDADPETRKLMGLKNSYEPKGKMVDEEIKGLDALLKTPLPPGRGFQGRYDQFGREYDVKTGKLLKQANLSKPSTPSTQVAHYELEGEVIESHVPGKPAEKIGRAHV